MKNKKVIARELVLVGGLKIKMAQNRAKGDAKWQSVK